MGRALDYSVCGRVDQRSDSMDNRVCLPETPHFKEREKKIVFYFYFHSVCVKSLDQFSLTTIQKKTKIFGHTMQQATCRNSKCIIAGK